MFLPIRIVTIIIFPINFLELTLSMIFTIQNTSRVDCSIGFLNLAIDISLLIINKTSFVDIVIVELTIIILEFSFAVLLPSLKLTHVMIIIIGILQISITIEQSLSKKPFINKLLSWILKLNYLPLPLEFAILKDTNVRGSILLSKLPFTIK